MLTVWLISSSILILVFLTLMYNQANLGRAPGIKSRLILFLTFNQAEINRSADLPELESPRFQQPPDQLFNKLIEIVDVLGWEALQIDHKKNIIQAVVTTPVWRFKDDMTISVIPEGDGSYIYAHSRSRKGTGDLAANSHHLQQLLEKLQMIGK